MCGHEHCLDPWCPEERTQPPRKTVTTLGVYPDQWKARRVLDDLLGGSPPDGYEVCESEIGWEVVRRV